MRILRCPLPVPATLPATLLATLLAALMPTGAARAAPPARADDGLSRLHEYRSWLVGCDNTRHCEAQGYAEEGGPPDLGGRAALIVQRAAGPGQAPEVRLRFARFDDTDRAPAADAPVRLAAGAWRQVLPPIDPRTEELVVPPAQVAALLDAVRRADRLHIEAGGQRWWVSLDGAQAALLKMDALQGRVGTPGALVRRGTRPESDVPQPAPPEVRAAALPPTTEADLALEPRVRAALPRSGQDCPGFDPGRPLPHLLRLDRGSLLAVQDCWPGAYQTGSRLWRVQDRPPFRAVPLIPPRPVPEAGDDGVLVIESLTADGTLTLTEAAKGRGLGDCWVGREWTWTARGLALTAADQSACRAFEGGGLPVTLWRVQRR